MALDVESRNAFKSCPLRLTPKGTNGGDKMLISDLQFIERDGKKILQMRKAVPQVDASGAFSGLEIAPQWQDVPLVDEMVSAK